MTANIIGIALMAVLLITDLCFCFIGTTRGIRHTRLSSLFKSKPLVMLRCISLTASIMFLGIIFPTELFGWHSMKAFITYIIVLAVFAVVYLVVRVLDALLFSGIYQLMLTAISSAIFIFSAISSHYIPLLVSSVIFALCSTACILSSHIALQNPSDI